MVPLVTPVATDLMEVSIRPYFIRDKARGAGRVWGVGDFTEWEGVAGCGDKAIPALCSNFVV